ncbi:uncharacterized protein MYCFIDRAFT_213618 [Pseudocercospora fijiensis CIRAD86]|uniref:Uncharacterized protein n=1 Tax=Pseudocercospora fijiensis (strain CIRAD86) TaxID=383855 RepID=N1QB96_PSEFD|nr:uncharacterized protein MYCFIDRAFT_213618 [Pseudocercospora fijiensis CIRAD86]EME89321.1 hypothetical protein MYCFIDRAFT_213618 [Pseudocercospora fijiensis CIRAD86]
MENARAPLCHVDANARVNKGPVQESLKRYKQRQDELESTTNAGLAELRDKQAELSASLQDHATLIRGVQDSIARCTDPTPWLAELQQLASNHNAMDDFRQRIARLESIAPPAPISSMLQFDARLRALESSRNFSELSEHLKRCNERLTMIEARHPDPSTWFRLTAINGLVEELQNRVNHMEEHRNLAPCAEQISQLEIDIVDDRRHRLNDIAELSQDIVQLTACSGPQLPRSSIRDDIEALRKRIVAEEAQPRDIMAAIKLLEHLRHSEVEISDTITLAPQQVPCQSIDSGRRGSLAGEMPTTRASRVSKRSRTTPPTPAMSLMRTPSEIRPAEKRKSLNTSSFNAIGEGKRRRSGRERKPKKHASGVVDWTQMT